MYDETVQTELDSSAVQKIEEALLEKEQIDSAEVEELKKEIRELRRQLGQEVE